MAFRSFRDSSGMEWQVYAVEPRAEEERRQGERRSGAVEVETPQDRRALDRRVSVGTTHPPRILDSWLTFERDTEKRRLTPLPEDWKQADDAQLEEWCRMARPARPPRDSD